MENRNECEIIRQRIEESVISIADVDRSEIHGHIGTCRSCREYAEQLELLSAIKEVRYSLPEHERTRFSAGVRTRIESQKSTQRKPAFITQPAFQIAVLIMVVVSVALLLINSEPDPEFIVAWDDVEYLHEYSFYYDDMIIPDDGMMTELYAEILFDEEFYLDEYWDAVFLNDDYYYGLDFLSPEEIEYLIQRLEGV